METDSTMLVSTIFSYVMFAYRISKTQLHGLITISVCWNTLSTDMYETYFSQNQFLRRTSVSIVRIIRNVNTLTWKIWVCLSMTSGCTYIYHSIFKRFYIMATWKIERRWENNTDMSMSLCERALNPLNAELNPICYLLALLAHHFLHVSRIRVKSLTLRLLMLYIYGAPILDVSRSPTTTQHSR